MSGRLCVVMPVYNERESVGPVLENWSSVLGSLGVDYVIRAYDDGSTDGTAAVLTAVADRLVRVEVRSGRNRGHGPTILRGYREALDDGFDWIFQVDSDGETGPEGFAGLWARREEFDFLVGRRTGREQGLARRIVSAVARMTVRVLFGRCVRDVNSPYRLMRASAFSELVVKVSGGTFAPNVILSGLAAAGRLRCHEEEIAFRPRTSGVCSIRKMRLVKAAIRSFAETVENGLGTRRGLVTLGALALLSLLAKVALTAVGHNFDFESYGIVTGILHDGASVYANTARYNYAPVWYNVLFVLDVISGSHLRLALAVFLGLVDVGIAGFLWRFVSRTAAALFLLSPLAVYISGFHAQFDNFAVAAALAAGAVLLRAEADRVDDRWTVLGAALLGVSLCIKHIFVFFPIWFLFRPIPWRRRLIVLFLPIAIFLLSFAPHVSVRAYPAVCADVRMLVREWRATGAALTERTEEEFRRQFMQVPELREPIGIIRNVFLYRSYPFAPFLRFFLPSKVAESVPGLPFMVLALAVIGFLCRRKDVISSMLVYSAGAVAFSPSVADQYLAIPLAFACATCSVGGIVYSLYAGMLLFVFLVTRVHPGPEHLFMGSTAILVWLLAVRARRIRIRTTGGA